MKKRMEFSKIVVATVMATYFIGVAVGAKVVLEHPSELSAYLAYIGAATSVTVSFYSWKAKAENEIKLGRSVGETESDFTYNNYYEQ